MGTRKAHTSTGYASTTQSRAAIAYTRRKIYLNAMPHARSTNTHTQMEKRTHISQYKDDLSHAKVFPHAPKKTFTREQNFISKFGNNISSLGNNISNLGNNISRLETTFSSRKKRFYQAYKAVFHCLYPIFYTRTIASSSQNALTRKAIPPLQNHKKAFSPHRKKDLPKRGRTTSAVQGNFLE